MSNGVVRFREPSDGSTMEKDFDACGCCQPLLTFLELVDRSVGKDFALGLPGRLASLCNATPGMSELDEAAATAALLLCPPRSALRWRRNASLERLPILFIN